MAGPVYQGSLVRNGWFAEWTWLEWTKDVTKYPRSIESIEKSLNCEIGFQDLETMLNLAKMYVNIEKVRKFQIQPFVIQILFFTTDDSFADAFFIMFHE